MSALSWVCGVASLILGRVSPTLGRGIRLDFGRMWLCNTSLSRVCGPSYTMPDGEIPPHDGVTIMIAPHAMLIPVILLSTRRWMI